ncbi:MAG: ferrochelatase [Anaerolineae bacterium]|nr:ferrochelatase [Anaerolineae bacterium]MDW8173689.1 ferrochelatase [Anaerolineae bacterium]
MLFNFDPAPVGVLLAQLGTPDAPTARALRPYLRQFLSDMRVIDYSPFAWQPILQSIILTFRPRRSARLYKRIWMEEGSPLLVYSRLQVEGLQARLGQGFRVILGMRYGDPSIESAMRQLEDEGINRIVVLPMFPQFSSTTTASIYDAVYTAAAGRRCPLFHQRKRSVPSLHFVPPYYAHPGYIEALAERVRESLAGQPMPDKLILSFHGIPTRYERTGDPYGAQCRATAEALAQALGLREDQWIATFQSRFGPEPWLTPATDETLERLAQAGTARVAILAPGFVADCLETIDELGHEGRNTWIEAGGDPEGFQFIPCLNDQALWLDALADITRREAQSWLPLSYAEPADILERAPQLMNSL